MCKFWLAMPISGGTKHRATSGTRNLNSRLGNSTDGSGVLTDRVYYKNTS